MTCVSLFRFDFQNENDFPQAQDERLQEIQDQRPAKKPRLAIADRSMELTFKRVEKHREDYVEIMTTLRAKERKRQLIKEAQQLAHAKIFGPGIVFEGSDVLAKLWTTGMDVRLSQFGNPLPPEEEGRMGTNLNDQFGQGEQDLFRDDNGEMPLFDGDQIGFPDPSFEIQADALQRPDLSWDVEIGRAGMDSQPVEMPWARRSTILAGADDSTLAGETTLGLNTRSFDIETPSGIRRISRRSDLSQTMTDNRRTLAGTEGLADPGEGFQLGEGEGIEAQEQMSSQTLAEQENVQFLNYITATRAELKEGEQLMFSDLAPVTDSQVRMTWILFYRYPSD